MFLGFRFCHRICAAIILIGVIYSCESSVLYFDFTFSSSIYCSIIVRFQKNLFYFCLLHPDCNSIHFCSIDEVGLVKDYLMQSDLALNS